MALKLTLLRAPLPAQSVIDVWVLVKASGTYTQTTGDVLDFTQLWGQVSQEGYTPDFDGLPIEADAISMTGGWGASGGGYYEVQTQSNANPNVAKALNACAFRAFAAGGTEESTGAYDTTIINDVIILHAVFARPQ
jgi:hypothetical protein